jgi:hypothetical protein
MLDDDCLMRTRKNVTMRERKIQRTFVPDRPNTKVDRAIVRSSRPKKQLPTRSSRVCRGLVGQLQLRPSSDAAAHGRRVLFLVASNVDKCQNEQSVVPQPPVYVPGATTVPVWRHNSHTPPLECLVDSSHALMHAQTHGDNFILESIVIVVIDKVGECYIRRANSARSGGRSYSCVPPKTETSGNIVETEQRSFWYYGPYRTGNLCRSGR